MKLRDDITNSISHVLSGFPQVRRAAAYLSRSPDDSYTIQIVLFGCGISECLIKSIIRVFKENHAGFALNISVRKDTADTGFIDHIHRQGIYIYQRDKA